MRYEVATDLTPQQALEQAIATFGPGGLGLTIQTQRNLSLVFQGGGGHIAITALPGMPNRLELETREWDYAVQKFMSRIYQRRGWWHRLWRRKRSTPSRPASLTILAD